MDSSTTEPGSMQARSSSNRPASARASVRSPSTRAVIRVVARRHAASASRYSSGERGRDRASSAWLRMIASGVPDQGAQPGQQLHQLERLDEVVIGAGVERAHPVADGVARREDQDGRLAPAAQPGEDLPAVQPRQHQVEDDRVVVPARRLKQPVFAVGGLVDSVTVFPQRPRKHGEQFRLVFDQQDPHRPPRPRSALMVFPVVLTATA